MRIGMGIDVHRLERGRPLIIGGVTIDYPKGLKGHSDADVLAHAICDALLGAAGLGDIGTHFPDTDPSYAGIDSMVLLSRSVSAVREKGYAIGNIDATVVAQAPRLAGYRDAMTQRLADAMAVRTDQINIKATTTEGLGYAGRGEGIAAHCVALLVDAHS